VYDVGLPRSICAFAILNSDFVMMPMIAIPGGLIDSLRSARTLQMVVYSGFFFGVGMILFNHGRRKWAFLWQLIGLAAAALNALGGLFSKLWLGAAVSTVVLAIDLWLMSDCWQSELQELRTRKK
jgi:hypothetical protein